MFALRGGTTEEWQCGILCWLYHSEHIKMLKAECRKHVELGHESLRRLRWEFSYLAVSQQFMGPWEACWMILKVWICLNEIWKYDRSQSPSPSSPSSPSSSIVTSCESFETIQDTRIQFHRWRPWSCSGQPWMRRRFLLVGHGSELATGIGHCRAGQVGVAFSNPNPKFWWLESLCHPVLSSKFRGQLQSSLFLLVKAPGLAGFVIGPHPQNPMPYQRFPL